MLRFTAYLPPAALGLAALGLSSTACSSAGGGDHSASPMSDDNAVIGGTAIDGSEFPHVGRLHFLEPYYCTGTVIAPNVVISAAHCVENGLGVSASPRQEFAVTETVTFEVLGTGVKSTVEAFASLRQHGDEDSFDVVMLRLKTPIALADYPAFTCDYPEVGETVTSVGYGVLGARWQDQRQPQTHARDVLWQLLLPRTPG